MKLRMPEYYRNFKCIADKCKDSCCSAGWEIDIDDETMNKYESVEGTFGAKLKRSICCTDGTYHFILDRDNNCPFLKEGLCEIYTKLGEKSLCKICAKHPRYYTWFNGFKEGGIGLCCEEAARIIISNSKRFSTFDVDVPDEDSEKYDKKLFKYLQRARKKIITHLEDDSVSLNNRIRNVIWYGNIIQQNMDFDLLDDDDIVDVSWCDENSEFDVNNIFEYMYTLEANDKKWIPFLKKYAKKYNDNFLRLDEYNSTFPDVDNYLKNIAIYFIWRYFIKGCFDGDVLSKVKLMGLSIFIIKSLLFSDWIQYSSINMDSCIRIAKKYSEEIEYCEDNLLKFYDDSYELSYFSVENFIELFY
ncbi:MAG: flagellin lysine-N-methylase [Clostridia bacterium]|nr:flagellin lysine-N-methylase [Clostridia bacterium]